MATQPAHHPLVAAYLRDLELLLHGLPPTERGEVLLGVRDHFEEALGADPEDDQVRAAIAELGPAVDIADEAYAAERGPSPALAPGAEPTDPPAWMRTLMGALLGWAGVCVLMFLVTRSTSTLILAAPALVAAAALATARPGWRGSRARIRVVIVPLGLALLLLTYLSLSPAFHPMELLYAFVLPIGPLCVVAAVMLRGATPWTARERAGLLTLVPAACAVLALLAWVNPAATGSVLVTVGGLGTLVAAWALLVVLTRRGLARAA